MNSPSSVLMLISDKSERPSSLPHFSRNYFLGDFYLRLGSYSCMDDSSSGMDGEEGMDGSSMLNFSYICPRFIVANMFSNSSALLFVSNCTCY